MIRASEQLRKRRQRQREAAQRAELIEEMAALLRDKLGADLAHFIELFSTIAPYALRERLFQELDRLPPPAEEEPPDLTSVGERLRAAHRASPHPSGFVIGRR